MPPLSTSPKIGLHICSNWSLLRTLCLGRCDGLEGWEGGLRRKGYMYTYYRFTSLYSRNQHNIGKQLYSKKEKREPCYQVPGNCSHPHWSVWPFTRQLPTKMKRNRCFQSQNFLHPLLKGKPWGVENALYSAKLDGSTDRFLEPGTKPQRKTSTHFGSSEFTHSLRKHLLLLETLLWSLRVSVSHRILEQVRLVSHSQGQRLACRGHWPLSQEILLSAATGKNHHSEVKKTHSKDARSLEYTSLAPCCRSTLFHPRNMCFSINPKPVTRIPSPLSLSTSDSPFLCSGRQDACSHKWGAQMNNKQYFVLMPRTLESQMAPLILKV